MGRPAARRHRRAALADDAARHPVLHVARHDYEYSNLGFAILGRVVSNVSHMPYARYVRRRAPSARHDLHDAAVAAGAGDPARARLSAAGRPVARGAAASRRRVRLDGRHAHVGERPRASGSPSCSTRGRRATVRTRAGEAVVAARDAAGGALQRCDGGAGHRHAHDAQRWRLRLRTRRSRNCHFPVIVSHSGGLPGFGSIMRWLPDYGVGIVAMGNLTYTGWGTVGAGVRCADAHRRTHRARAAAGTGPHRGRDQVTRLVTHWDDALADSLAAMNLYLDESKPRRRAQIEKAMARGGLPQRRAVRGGQCTAWPLAHALREWRPAREHHPRAHPAGHGAVSRRAADATNGSTRISACLSPMTLHSACFISRHRC